MGAGSRAPSKVTLNELLDTLRLLEEEPELLPPPKLLKKDRCAWMDRVSWGMRLLCPSLGSVGCLVRNSRALPGKVVEELGVGDGEFGGGRGIVWCIEGLDICKEQQPLWWDRV